MKRGDLGAALVFVVLLTLALFALGHGLLLSAGAEYVAAGAGARLAGRWSLADGGVRRALASGHGYWMDSVPLGGARSTTDSTSGGSTISTRWRRLSAEAWLVESDVRSPRGLPGSSGRLAWSLDPATRIRALPATLSVGSASTVVLRGPVEPTWGEVTGTVDDAGLGLRTFRSLLAAAAPIGGRGTPAPRVASGRCVTADAWNWGDPDRPSEACGAHVAFVGARGDVVVTGGAGRVLLVADGDVELVQGARVSGLILASGVLRLADGAVFEGMAVALGGVDVDATSEVRASPASAVRVLDAQRPIIGSTTILHSAHQLRPRSP